MLSTILFMVAVSSNLSNGSKILGIVTTPSYSHHVAFHQLWQELSLRGHQLTVLTTDPIKNSSLTNLTEIDLHSAYETFGPEDLQAGGKFGWIRTATKFSQNIVDYELSQPEVKALIANKSEHFDVVLVEGLEMVMAYFSERFQCPYIQIYPLEVWARIYRDMGNPTNPVLYPNFALAYSKKLSFYQRLESLVYEIYNKLYIEWIGYPIVDKLVQKHFGVGYPSVQEVKRNVSLLFINTHLVLYEVRPLLPNIIQIGGVKLMKPQRQLPDDLQKWLDSAKNGFIYVSYGTNIKSKDLPHQTRQTLLQVFAQLPYLVLWKFELDDLPGKSSNVIISKWLPQQDILRHPNIRLFVTQGGLQSMEEAIYAGVPMVGYPFFVDQPKNIQVMISHGIGIGLAVGPLDGNVFKSSVEEVIKNSKYKCAVVRLAALMRDQPMTGLEKAVWWTEYVIRHKGAQHLRSPALEIEWYKYFMLDIGAFLLTVLLVLVLVLKLIIGKLLGKFGVRKLKKH